MLTILVSLLVCVIGGLVHMLVPKLATLGGYAFAVGLFFVLSETAHHVLHLG
jgi:hypothetical protein